MSHLVTVRISGAPAHELRRPLRAILRVDIRVCQVDDTLPRVVVAAICEFTGGVIDDVVDPRCHIDVLVDWCDW